MWVEVCRAVVSLLMSPVRCLVDIDDSSLSSGQSGRAAAAGVQVAYKDCPGMIHGFFNYGKYIDEGINIRKWVAAEINKVLGA